MQKRNYQQQSLAGMNPVELVIALYDGMVRFLNQAIAATEAGDVHARRIAVKRVLDILMHLQSRLRMDVGGPAKSLSEFYAAVFALCLEGSRLSSAERFQEAVRCVLNVREAWQQVAQDPEVRAMYAPPAALAEASVRASGWTAV
jgi:flagellar protein FliS